MGTGMVIQGEELVFTGPRHAVVRPFKLEREGNRSDKILVYSSLQGISAGTELVFYRGDFPLGMENDLPSYTGQLSYPFCYGYSNVGVDEKGRRVFGFAPHRTVWEAKAQELLPLPSSIIDERAVFIPNLETALGIVQDLNAIPGETIAVTGLGVVGALVLEVLRNTHYGKLIVFDLRISRKQIAEDLGAIFLNPADPETAQVILDLTQGRGLDSGVNVSGSSAGLQLLIDTMGKEGRIIEASWYGSRKVELFLGEAFHRKRLRIYSSQVSNIGSALANRWDKKRRLETVFELLSRIQAEKYISHRFPFKEASKAFILLDEGQEDILQVVLECQSREVG